MIYTCTFNPAIDYMMQVEQFELGDLNRTTGNHYVAGGKGINVSIVLNNLKVENIATGFVGGFTGKFVEDYLNEKYSIITKFTEVKEVTRINVKLSANHKETEINALGPIVSKKEFQEFKEFISNLNSNDILVIGGNPARGAASSYLELVKLCHKEDIPYVIDSNKNHILEVLPYNPLFIKPNIKELEEMFDEKITNVDDIIYYGEKLLELGARNMIVSLGKDGAVFINKEHRFISKGIEGKAVNTVGSGDSMVAGFIAKYMQTKDYKEAFKYAVACGTATAFSLGLATKDKADKIYQNLRVEELL